MAYTLVIGNKNTSSWSLRPWIAMRAGGIPFEEARIDLRAADAKAQILARTPSGKVPALTADGEVIWDSLAIIEFLAETHPDAKLWPQERIARARARAVSAEMHSSFQPLRLECPMDFLARTPRQSLSEACAADVRRIVALWGDCRGRFGTGGPFLFGPFTAADAMYAPVVSRFATYVPDLARFGDDGRARDYVAAMLDVPAMQEWGAGAKAEVSAGA
ncbi:MAG: glutathione S-transferase family protein [Hyphomicrobiaceae bacterium]|nr:glutathione S-transferase family protein [Hyphomicrobiaceae bacterium]